MVVLHLGLKVQDVLGEDLLLRNWLFESVHKVRKFGEVGGLGHGLRVGHVGFLRRVKVLYHLGVQ